MKSWLITVMHSVGLVGLLVVHHVDLRVELREHVVARLHRVDARARCGGSPASAAGRCRRPPTSATPGCAGPGRAGGSGTWCRRGTCRSRRSARRCARRATSGCRAHPVDDLAAGCRAHRRWCRGTATAPSVVELGLRRLTDSHSAVKPSRKSAAPKSSSPVCSDASADDVVGAEISHRGARSRGTSRPRPSARSCGGGRGRRAPPPRLPS